MDYVRLDFQILENKLCRVGIVCENATYFGGRKENIFWLFFLEEFPHLSLVHEIEFFVCSCNDICISLCG